MNNKIIATQVFCLVAFLCFSHSSQNAHADDYEHPFPMSEGTYWTYEGTVRWTHENSNRVSETNVTWRSEVRRFIRHGDVRAAVIRGLPSDLDWSDGSPQPSDSLLVESRGNLYRVSDEHVEESLRRLEQPSDDLAGMLQEYDLFLKWPLQKGEKFCDAEGMARPDTMYCWFVESSLPMGDVRIAGVAPARRTAYVIIYRTNPDHIQFTFVPGIGMTAYEYHHHGTVADTKLNLIEFHNSSAN